VTGYLPAQEVDAWYARASIFAFPSLDEGFGMPVLEAMASGLPVVASNRSALPEAAGDAAILVDPTRVDEIAGALETLIRRRELRAQYAVRGRLHAAGFTWEKAAAATWSVYAGLLEKRMSGT
jgi:glycosyltransferase involved in cell wall biosynthesis